MQYHGYNRKFSQYSKFPWNLQKLNTGLQVEIEIEVELEVEGFDLLCPSMPKLYYGCTIPPNVRHPKISLRSRRQLRPEITRSEPGLRVTVTHGVAEQQEEYAQIPLLQAKIACLMVAHQDWRSRADRRRVVRCKPPFTSNLLLTNRCQMTRPKGCF